MFRLLIFLVTLSVRALRAIFRTRETLLIENLALRQQVAALKKERPRPVLDDLDRAFWVALRMLYVLFVIEHGRRRIVHFNVTPNPTSAWVIQQLREAFPYDTAPRHLIFDRDTIFSPAVVRFVKAMGTKPTRTAYRCPWQNPVAERWIGSCRRELLEHVVVLGERHLVRLIRSYLEYYHEDRSHLGLAKDAPNRRSVTPRRSPTAKVVALPRVGGLHHRYEWREAA